MRRTLCALAALNQGVQTGKMKVTNFKDWKFRDPPSYAALPIDQNPEYNVPMAVKNAVFSKVPTEGLTGTLHLVCASDDALTDILDLDPSVAESAEFIDFVAGKYLPTGGQTVSHRYGGYQFGFWADQLGDGRAHVLGEYVNSRWRHRVRTVNSSGNERTADQTHPDEDSLDESKQCRCLHRLNNTKGESWQPQLKGSGETPYSRFGDGRAVLRSSIREMVASEACHYLGVPTTRAAALVVSDEHKVYRDKTYSGAARPERCATVVRLAPAWYRPGSLEILQKRAEPATMTTLIHFIIKHHFPSINPDNEDRYVEWFSEVAHRNLDMVATWQGIGFTHGVLNTDNLSVLGLTIDYGPYGFVEHYNPHYVPNTSDEMGRYAFNKQPSIILWNMEKLAQAMVPVLTEDQIEKINKIRNTLEEYVENRVLNVHIKKLGLEDIQDGDQYLVDELFRAMQNTMADFTATFRQLSELDPKQLVDKEALDSKWSLAKVSSAPGWEKWVQRYQKRLEKENVSEEQRRERMRKVNPVYVPRNWILQEAIADAEKNDFEKVRFLMKLFRAPYELNEEAERRGYSAQPPSWSYGLKLSCSS